MRTNAILWVGTFVTVAFLTTAASCSTSSGINNQPQSAGGGATGTSGSPAAAIAHLGSSVTITGNNNEELSVQLVKIVDPTASSDGFSSPDAGKRYVAAQFKLTNTGTVAYSDAPDNDAKVLDAQGQSFSPDFTDTAAGPEFASNSVNIGPGASELGFITFQVTSGDPVAKVQFTTDSGFGQTAEWLVP